MEKIKDNYLFFIIIIAFIGGKLLLWDTYFFWDSIATLSIPAHFLFENNFSSVIFPHNMVDDNLALSSLLAFTWKIFGRTITVTHIFFIFTGIILIYQSYKLCKIFVPDNKIFPYIFLLFISDPALITQSLLFMTDTVMVLFAVMSIRYMLENKKIAFSLSILGLSLLRARGFCMCIGIGLSYYIYLLFQNNWRNFFKLLFSAIIPFIPGIVFFITFSVFRSVSTGSSYYFFRENNPWAEHYHIVEFKHFIKNIAAAGRCFLDYGRCFIWIIFGIIFFRFGFKRVFKIDISTPGIILSSTLLCMLFVTIPVTNPFGFRYFMLQYMFCALILGILLFRLLKQKWARTISICLIIGLWSGHLWIYPDKTPNGWDATLAHLPYYKLRQDALNYLDKNNIDFQTVGFFFPAESKGKYIELNNDERSFAEFDTKKNKYIAFSNIANWNDELIDEITQHWILKKEFSRNSVFIRIYKNPLLTE